MFYCSVKIVRGITYHGNVFRVNLHSKWMAKWLTSLTKWLSVRLQIKWMLVRFSLQSLNLPVLYCCKETRKRQFLPVKYKKFCKIVARKFCFLRYKKQFKEGLVSFFEL